MMKRYFSLQCVVVALHLIVWPSHEYASAECSTSQPKTAATLLSASSEPIVQTPPQLLIDSGDLLSISVFGAPEFDTQVRVSATGDVSLPTIGSVHLGGLTTAQAEALISKVLVEANLFTDPHVSIFEKDYVRQGVSV